MLAFIEGRVVECTGDGRTVLKVGDMGIAVEMLRREAQALELDEEVRLHTVLHISTQEPKPTLYGFLQSDERDIFELLLRSHGIGPRVAMTLLELEPASLVAAIENEELAVLTSVPGVGAKTAQRLVLELRGKFKELAERLPEIAIVAGAQRDLADALRGLGFSPREISSALAALKKAGHEVEQLPVDELLRLVLGEMRR